jgi:hypothetical protein
LALFLLLATILTTGTAVTWSETASDQPAEPIVLHAGSTLVRDQPVQVTITAAPRDKSTREKLERVVLWINDHQYRTWQTGDGEFRYRLSLPPAALRHGKNLLLAQCFNRAGKPAESPVLEVEAQRPTARPDLYALFVGVGDYSRTNPKQKNLNSNNDVREMSTVWGSQRGKLYGNIRSVLLTDQQVTRKKILHQLRAFRTKVKPDDHVIVYLCGLTGSRQSLLEMPAPNKLLLPPLAKGDFLFLCSDFDYLEIQETSLWAADLLIALQHLAGHKILFVDASRAGQLIKDRPVGGLPEGIRRGGAGPIIFAACASDEVTLESFDVWLKSDVYGIFSAAVRKTIESQFTAADVNKNKTLEAQEVADHLRVLVAQSVHDLRQKNDGAAVNQHPVAHIPRLEKDTPLFVAGPSR